VVHGSSGGLFMLFWRKSAKQRVAKINKEGDCWELLLFLWLIIRGISCFV